MHNQESIPPSSNPSTIQSSWSSVDHHLSRFPKCLSPDPIHRRWCLQDCIRNPVWAVEILSYAIWVAKCTSDALGLHWQLSMALYWWPCCVWCWWYPHLLNPWERARRLHPKHATLSTQISARSEGQKMSIWKLSSVLVRISQHFGCEQNGVRLHIHTWWLADSAISSGCAIDPWPHTLLPVIYSEMFKGNGWRITLPKETRLKGIEIFSRCWTCIWSAQKPFYPITKSTVFQSVEMKISANWCKPLCNHQHSYRLPLI